MKIGFGANVSSPRLADLRGLNVRGSLMLVELVRDIQKLLATAGDAYVWESGLITVAVAPTPMMVAYDIRQSSPACLVCIAKTFLRRLCFWNQTMYFHAKGVSLCICSAKPSRMRVRHPLSPVLRTADFVATF